MANELGRVGLYEQNAATVNSLINQLAERVSLLSAGHIPGVTNGSDAAAGEVGEFQKVSRSDANPFVFSSSVFGNILTLPLTAGDWDVWATIFFNPDSGTTTTTGVVGLNDVSLTFPSPVTDPLYFGRVGLISMPAAGYLGAGTSGNLTIPVGPTRFLKAASFSVFAVGLASFSGGGLRSYGQLSARRRR